ncbi:MAG: peptidyl-prolyl cis-trans isomerase D [Candidatus Azotimanducaceae bacterium]|jgi:peptidyl-prolyl cis-trans isomerase D
MLIQQMRDGSDGILAKVIIGLIIIVFSLFGFGSITTFLAPVPKVASVNGEDVTQQSMEMAVERNRRMLVARGTAPADIDEDLLRENVLQSLITREILTQAAGAFGLFYGDGALDQEIVAQEVFSIDGVFNADQFQNVIRGAGYSPLSYRDEMRTDKLFDQMLSGIGRSAFVTESEAQRYSQLFSQTRDIAFLQISADSMLDGLAVTEDQISAYYGDNTENFVTDETVNIAYIELTHAGLAAGLDVEEDELRQYFDEKVGDYVTDERRRLAHILVEVSEDVDESAARTKADEVYERIKNGEDFSELAKTESDDFGSRLTGGDLGFTEQGAFLPEFELAAYDLALNQVSPPVQTDQGFHLIKVLGIEEAVTPAFDEIRAELEQTYRLAATEDEFVSLSSSLAELLFEGADSLELASSTLGVEIQTTGHLSRDADHELMQNNAVVSAVFSVQILIDGENSDPIDLGGDRLVGLRVQEYSPSEVRSVDEVAEDIRYILQRKGAAELAESRAEGIVEAIRGGSLAAFAANQFGLSWEVLPGASRFVTGVNPLILREAFALPRPAENKESLGTMVTPGGDTVVLRVSAVNERSSELIDPTEIANIQNTFANQLGSFDFQDIENGLTEAASIETAN